jgi:hypothetical protein
MLALMNKLTVVPMWVRISLHGIFVHAALFSCISPYSIILFPVYEQRHINYLTLYIRRKFSIYLAPGFEY